jgi:hypothetical protein
MRLTRSTNPATAAHWPNRRIGLDFRTRLEITGIPFNDPPPAAEPESMPQRHRFQSVHRRRDLQCQPRVLKVNEGGGV